MTVRAKGMAHAGQPALDELEPLLARVRRVPGMREGKRGSFQSRYRVSLHFHEDETGLYADLRLQDDTRRVRVSTNQEQESLIEVLTAGLAFARANPKSSSRVKSTVSP